MKKILPIVMNALPILLMIGLIPLVANDYWLAFFYAVIILGLLAFKRERNDITVFILGAVVMMFFEYVFISTGVEVFTRDSLFGMPLWLPLLWGYGFVAIKRSLEALNR